MAYTEVTISGYNSAPPADDGSAGPTNQVKWSTIKSKLFDPQRTAILLIDDRAASAITTADASLVILQAAVSAASSNVTALATTLSAPQGTALLLQQSSAPTGWAKGSTYDDYALRLVTGTSGGTTAGSTAFTSVFTARTLVMPAHTHTFSDAGSNASFSGDTTHVYDVGDNNEGGLGGGNSTRYQSVNNNNDTITGTWSFSVTSSSAGSGGTWDFAIQYVDVILVTKS